MSVIEVVEAGPYTSVQDTGRYGAQRYGLGTAGAMDTLSLAIANVLVSQPAGAAAIEIGPLPARFRITDGAVRLALAGGVRGATVQGRALPMGETVLLAEGDVLALRACSQGVFSYLAFEGGIDGEPVFGSFSVHARSGIGSPYSRALLPGDRLNVGGAAVRGAERSLAAPTRGSGALRVVLGPQDDHFEPETIAQFLDTEWKISATSDRMGYRLEGPALRHKGSPNILSDGIANGSVQIPGNGLPLLLLADRGTTGGYPKLATIISADLGRLAQVPVGSVIRFQAIAVEEAQAEARAHAALISSLPRAVRDVGGGDLSSEFLLASNLAGAATSADDWSI
ncbi:MAG TPA: biotin-dependent carboxyltransferase family protein [Beijerinckiaceae bacterium]|nr:biotin-dependent carboxyltransferase family protein [Beijerinckiaceae bacterium]